MKDQFERTIKERKRWQRHEEKKVEELRKKFDLMNLNE